MGFLPFPSSPCTRYRQLTRFLEAFLRLEHVAGAKVAGFLWNSRTLCNKASYVNSGLNIHGTSYGPLKDDVRMRGIELRALEIVNCPLGCRWGYGEETGDGIDVSDVDVR